jgi:hypothetical protein
MECYLSHDCIILPLKLAFQHLSMDDDKFEVCPSSLDWEELGVMKDFLEPFHQGNSFLFD